jgi:hypothetical protein
MELTELIDFKRVQDLVGQPLQIKRFALYDVAVLSREQPEALLEFGAAAWHRIVQQGHFSVDPRMMHEYFDARNPAIIQAIERVIKMPLIQDLGWTEATIRVAWLAALAVFAALVFSDGDEFHLGGDDALAGIVHLADIHAGFRPERALHDIGKIDRAGQSQKSGNVVCAAGAQHGGRDVAPADRPQHREHSGSDSDRGDRNESAIV